MVNRDTIFSLIIILLSLGAYVQVGDLSLESRFFPRVASVILIILNLINLFKHVKQGPQDKIFAKVRLGRLITMAIGIILYLTIMIYVGFVFSSLLFMIFFMWYLNEERKNNGVKILLKSVFLSLFVVGLFYGMFHYLFMIPLPEGLLFAV